jgi:hypothetical protein
MMEGSMATKLNQIIAVEKGVKGETYSKLTDLHQSVQKAPLLSGIARTYRPKDEEGDVLPPESTRVQINTEKALQDIAGVMTRLFDVVATKDWTNCTAKANVVVGGQVLLNDVPTTYLLFLEKQLADMHTFVKKLPTLDPAEAWEYDQAADCWATKPVQTVRTKKVMRNHVKAEATKEHPAQVDVYSEDVIVGYWQTVKFSGALPAARVNELVARVEALQEAVKFAREEANNTEVVDQKPGAKVFQYLFAK